MANIEYAYNKLRKNFGKQPMFCQVRAHLLDSIVPDKSEQKKYCLRNPVHKESQVSIFKQENYINTNQVTFENQGVNHAEGGWPKDIHHADEDSTTRYRRRIERDDTYIDAVLGTYDKLTKCIKQNNAIEMYDMFFKNMRPVLPIEKTAIQLNNAYRDKDQRPIGSMCWTFEDDSKLIVGYCDKRFPIKGSLNRNLSCSVWNLENPNEPEQIFLPPSACWQATASPNNPSLIIGGLEDGRVCIFDIRSQKQPVAISPAHLAHREPVTALVYMQSRLNLEFFSGSTDGSCNWWDVRNISGYTDTLIMSVRAPPGEKISQANSEPVTALQFDKSFPTKFLCGTDTGLVISVNRKGKSPKEIMSSVFEAQLGPVKAVHRSPCVSKMFITCGDWTAHIWTEDICISPIITGISGRYPINDVAWAPQRLSAYMTVSSDGVFRIWDLLRKYREPTKMLLLSKESALLKVTPHHKGRLVAVGDARGIVYSLSLSYNLAISADKDKQLLIQTYEREHHREHILETRVKEIRLKQTTVEKAVGQDNAVDEEALIKNAEEAYHTKVGDEVLRTGFSLGSGPSRKKAAIKSR